MRYLKEIVGFNGQIAIIYSIIAAIFCLIFIPQDIRQRIIFRIHKRHRTLKYVIRSNVDKNGNFIILSGKQNDKIIKNILNCNMIKFILKYLTLENIK